MAERVQRIWKTLITNKYRTQVSWTRQKGKPPVLKSEMFKLAVGGIYFNFILFRARLLFFFIIQLQYAQIHCMHWRTKNKSKSTQKIGSGSRINAIQENAQNQKI